MAKSIKKPFSFRLSDEVRTALETQARAKGMSESDLGRQILCENLMGQSSEQLERIEQKLERLIRELRSLAALGIAANSQTFDEDDAKQLVEQHLALDAGVPS